MLFTHQVPVLNKIVSKNRPLHDIWVSQDSINRKTADVTVKSDNQVSSKQGHAQKVSLCRALLNAQSLSTKQVNKPSTPEINTIFESHDVVLLTETWSNNFSHLHFEN